MATYKSNFIVTLEEALHGTDIVILFCPYALCGHKLILVCGIIYLFYEVLLTTAMENVGVHGAKKGVATVGLNLGELNARFKKCPFVVNYHSETYDSNHSAQFILACSKVI